MLSQTEGKKEELSDLGFIPLVYCKGTDFAAFFAVQSVNKPRLYNTDQANANAKLSSQLQYILATTIRTLSEVIVRDKVGSFMSKTECQTYLQNWIMQYVVASDNAGQETKARYPLREASIEVVEFLQFCSYRAIAWIKPHFQLEGLSMSLRLVADLPSGKLRGYYG
ncbi:type VI secretion system contractile sheath domain-containing protein [Escherichia coli]